MWQLRRTRKSYHDNVRKIIKTLEWITELALNELSLRVMGHKDTHARTRWTNTKVHSVVKQSDNWSTSLYSSTKQMRFICLSSFLYHWTCVCVCLRVCMCLHVCVCVCVCVCKKKWSSVGHSKVIRPGWGLLSGIMNEINEHKTVPEINSWTYTQPHFKSGETLTGEERRDNIKVWQ